MPRDQVGGLVPSRKQLGFISTWATLTRSIVLFSNGFEGFWRWQKTYWFFSACATVQNLSFARFSKLFQETVILGGFISTWATPTRSKQCFCKWFLQVSAAVIPQHQAWTFSA